MTAPDLASIRIAAVPEIRIARLRHQGDPARLGETIRRFIAWRKSVGLPPRKSRTFNVLLDDPHTTPPEEFRFDLGAATERPIAPNEAGVVEDAIPAGRCAVLRVVGPDELLAPAFEALYGDWLPESGELPADRPLFLERVAFYPEVPALQAIVDIHLPLLG